MSDTADYIQFMVTPGQRYVLRPALDNISIEFINESEKIFIVEIKTVNDKGTELEGSATGE